MLAFSRHHQVYPKDMQTYVILLISSLWRSSHRFMPLLPLVVAFALLVPHYAGAEEASAGAEEASVVNSNADPEESTVDTSHKQMSNFLESILTRADSLFSGNRSYDAPTGSYVALGGAYTLRKNVDGGNELDPLTRAKINLPKTKNRFQLLLDREIENLTKSESQRDAQVAAGQIAADDNPYLALRGVARETLNVALTADVGARLRLDPDPFVRVRARRVFSLGAWELPLSETLLYRYDEKFSAVTELACLRSVGDNIAIGIILNATYRDFTGGFDLGTSAAVGWRINDRSLIATEIGAYGQTEPEVQDTAYSFSLRYRRKIYKEWLVLELRPQLILLPQEDFREVPYFTVQLEMYFGSNYFDNL